MRAALASLPNGPSWLVVLVVGLTLGVELLHLWKDWPPAAPVPPIPVGIDPDACEAFCDGSELPVQAWEPFRCECAPARPSKDSFGG